MTKSGQQTLGQEKWPQRHRDTEQKEKKAFPTISFSLFLCVSVSLWQNKCLNVACPDLDRAYERAG